MIAALYVQTGGCYFGLDGVDPWDEPRDARLYPGPWPVVAHPPCTRWCRLAGLVERRYGYKRGDDGGAFASALSAVRKWGGVLEHPAHTKAWPAFGLRTPPGSGGWVAADKLGGWTCHIEQGRYGHRARKATWLYAARVRLPRMRWGTSRATAVVGFCARRGDGSVSNCVGLPRLSKQEGKATPPQFRDVLIAMARSVSPQLELYTEAA